jgi:hypothetical protein
MPIDDQYHPQALDFIPDVDGDLIIDRCQYLQGGDWIPTWNLGDTHNRAFAPAGIGPFRRYLIPMYVESFQAYWCDYLFYLLAIRDGVKVYKTDNYRMIHDLGDDHETISGRNSDSVKRQWADDQLSQIRHKLGI